MGGVAPDAAFDERNRLVGNQTIAFPVVYRRCGNRVSPLDDHGTRLRPVDGHVRDEGGLRQPGDSRRAERDSSLGHAREGSAVRGRFLPMASIRIRLTLPGTANSDSTFACTEWSGSTLAQSVPRVHRLAVTALNGHAFSATVMGTPRSPSREPRSTCESRRWRRAKGESFHPVITVYSSGTTARPGRTNGSEERRSRDSAVGARHAKRPSQG